MNTPKWIIIHHTGGTDTNPKADTSHHTAKMVDAWHTSKGWNGIGYNWFIEKNGEPAVGRDEKIDGAHTIGYNSQSIGICLAGNFDVTYPTKEQEITLRKLILSKMVQYNIPASNVVPHRKFAKKSCYGNLLSNKWIQDLIKPQEVKEEIIDGSVQCKEYLAKQNNNVLIEFLKFILARFK